MSAPAKQPPKICPTTKALHKIVPSDIVELHWPNGDGVELVQVLLVEKQRATVERLDFFNHEDSRASVRREWLRPYHANGNA